MNDDSSGVQMVFPQELPMVMDEAEAVETVCNHVEEIFYSPKSVLLARARAKARKERAKALQRPLEKLLPTPVLGAKAVTWNTDGNFKL